MIFFMRLSLACTASCFTSVSNAYAYPDTTLLFLRWLPLIWNDAKDLHMFNMCYTQPL